MNKSFEICWIRIRALSLVHVDYGTLRFIFSEHQFVYFYIIDDNIYFAMLV